MGPRGAKRMKMSQASFVTCTNQIPMGADPAGMKSFVPQPNWRAGFNLDVPDLVDKMAKLVHQDFFAPPSQTTPPIQDHTPRPHPNGEPTHPHTHRPHPTDHHPPPPRHRCCVTQACTSRSTPMGSRRCSPPYTGRRVT